jgi:branched-chain amino acid transport system permease protein
MILPIRSSLMAYLLQQLANAIPLAALYAALAFGYSLAFGVTKRADITYGAIFAFAGQILLLFTDFGYNRLWLILPAALAVGAAASVVYSMGAGLWIGRSIMLPLVRQSSNSVIVAALGITIVLMETARLASNTRSLWLPPFLNSGVVFWREGSFEVVLTQIQLINTAMMCAFVGIGSIVLKRSSWGRVWRAVTDDPLAAELCGTSANRVFLVAYAAAALVATLCGDLSTAYYGTMDFGAGLMFGLKVLMVAAVGGYSDPLKSAGGAASLGVVETLWTAYGPFLWRDFVVFSLLVLLLVCSRRERAVP